MPATSKVILFPKKNSDGTQSVMLRVTFSRKCKYFTLNIYCKSDQWSKEFDRLRKNFPEYIAQNERIQEFEQRALDVLREFERDNTPFTFSKFEEKVFTAFRGYKSTYKVVDWLMDISNLLLSDGHRGNSNRYKETGQTVLRFRKNAYLIDIDADWLRAFERWHRNGNYNDGGISVNMRTLRAACNRAIDQKIMPKSWYPFDEYTIKHLRKASIKRAITISEMKKIEEVELHEYFLILSRDLFVFSFLTRGMNLVDIANLVPKNISNGERIIYKRQKTRKEYSIKLSPKSIDLIKKYNIGNEYIFPIYNESHDTDQKKFNRLRKIQRIVNRSIKEVANRAGVDGDSIIFYTARHTYATSLKKSGVSIEVISQALGHSDFKTTDIYLKAFDDSVIDSADDLIYK